MKTLMHFLPGFVLLCFALFSNAASFIPYSKNSFSTNEAGTPVVGVNNISITNQSDKQWQFYGANPETVARLQDVTNAPSISSNAFVSSMSLPSGLNLWTNVPKRIVIAGDSLSTFSITNWPYFFSNRMSSLGITQMIDVAVSGRTSSNVWNNYAAEITPYAPITPGNPPALLMVLAGINDFSFDWDPNISWSFISNIWRQGKAEGFEVVGCSQWPLWSLGYQRVDGLATFNGLMRSQATNIDYFVDYANTMWNSGDTNITYDGLHTTARGADMVAQQLQYILSIGKLFRPLITENGKAWLRQSNGVAGRPTFIDRVTITNQNGLYILMDSNASTMRLYANTNLTLESRALIWKTVDMLPYDANVAQVRITSTNLIMGKSVAPSSTNLRESVILGSGTAIYGKNHSYSTLVGDYSGAGLEGNGDGTTFLGYYSGFGATNANDALIVGVFAGQWAANGQYATILGHKAGLNATNSTRSIYLGYQAGYTNNRANTLIIDSQDATAKGSNAFIYGELDNRLLTINGHLRSTGTVSGLTAGFDNASISNFQAFPGTGGGIPVADFRTRALFQSPVDVSYGSAYYGLGVNLTNLNGEKFASTNAIADYAQPKDVDLTTLSTNSFGIMGPLVGQVIKYAVGGYWTNAEDSTIAGAGIDGTNDPLSGITFYGVNVFDFSATLHAPGQNITNLNGDNISSGTVADARIASTIARDSEVSGITNNSLFGWSGLATNTAAEYWTNAALGAALNATNLLATQLTANLNSASNAISLLITNHGTVVSNAAIAFSQSVSNNGLYGFSGWTTQAVTLGWSNTVDYASNILWTAKENATNLLASQLTANLNSASNSISASYSNTVDYASNVVWLKAQGVTNNTKIARTDFDNVFSGSNFFTGRILADIPDEPTNSLDGVVIPLGKVTLTNCAGNITFTGLSGVDTSKNRKALVHLLSGGAERTIVIPASWKNHDVATTFYVSNGWNVMLSIETYGDYMTNVAWIHQK